MQGTLYLVATPIGNLADITKRAINSLQDVDIIACEDTRHSFKLLAHLGIQKPLVSYHKHNERQSAQEIVAILKGGKSVALISDAGMPCISDPGAYLVRAAREADCTVTVIPGASAVTSAVALSGIEADGFVFLAFLQGTDTQKRKRLAQYITEPLPLVIYSAPHDIKKELALAHQVLGARDVIIIKEITKVHEKVVQGRLGNIELENTKGEFVLIIAGCVEMEVSEDTIVMELAYLLNFGLSKRDAAEIAAKHLAITKKRAYDLCLVKFG